MRVDLKSDQYYDFHNIRYVKIIDDDGLIIEGNYAKGKKYYKVEMLRRMVDDKSYKKLVRYMKEYMQRFDFEGCCPFCENLKVWLIQDCKRKVLINDPKQKDFIYDEKDVDYQCGYCHKRFPKERLKYVDIVMYHK